MQTSRALIGREDDLDALRSMVAALEGPPGPVQVLVLAGEAGIGKTRLVSELLEDGEPEREAIVVRGRCIDLDRDAPPYAPVRSLLRSLLARVGPEAVLEAAGPSVGALALLVPEVADHASVATADGADRLFDAVAVLLTTLSAEHPLVVVVEDLHWADQASLALLRYLVRAGEAARILLVVTVRSDELGSAGAVRGWLADLERLPSVRRRTLSRLSRRQVRQLAESLRPAPLSSSDVTRVYERSEGVPFYVEELVCSGAFDAQSEFPETLRDVLLARYATLADSTQRLVRVLSAGGDRVAHDVLDTVLTVWPGSADTSTPPSGRRSRPAWSRSTATRTPSGTRWCARLSTVSCSPESACGSTPPTRWPSRRSRRSGTWIRPRCPTTGWPPTTSPPPSPPRSRPWPVPGRPSPSPPPPAWASARSTCGTRFPTPRCARGGPGSSCSPRPRTSTATPARANAPSP
ncbi:hypothetical protein DVJ78_13085 [Humibacter sp. BT305]|nr:hypothetical protein DVJ78_13085 [Humibacter sp. BT305]